MDRLDASPSRETSSEPLESRVDVAKEFAEDVAEELVEEPKRKPTRYTSKFYEILEIEDAQVFDKALDRIELGWPRLSFLKDENFWENPTSDAESFQNFVKIAFDSGKGRMYKALAVIDAFIAKYPKFLTNSGDLADSLRNKRDLIKERIGEYESTYVNLEPSQAVVLKKVKPKVAKDGGAKKTAPTKPSVAPVINPSSTDRPKLGSDEFYKLYEITDVYEFKKILRPLNIWIENDKWKELSSPTYWGDLGPLASSRRQSTVRRLFDGKDGAITSLVSDLDTLSDIYPDFFTDMDNPDSKKYRELFDLVMRRLFEYYKVENFDSAAIDNHVLDTMLAYVENNNLDKVYRKKILQKMISYVLEIKILDSGKFDVWEELEAEYIEKLKEFK